MLLKVLFLCFCIALTTTSAAPPKPPPTTYSKPTAVGDAQLVQPHFITIEHFETLLRRAGELFRPIVFPVPESTSGTAESISAPYQQMHPPTEDPYDFYLPPFEHENTKLDAKSRKMEHISPPPVPSSDQDQTNYYAVKPKKLPKKFHVGAKHVNMKWLNAFEKEALADAFGELPKAVYLVNDERNRINFDDSFFGVDMQVKMPNNQPHKEQTSANSAGQAQEDDFHNQGEDDLVAAAAELVPQLQQRA